MRIVKYTLIFFVFNDYILSNRKNFLYLGYSLIHLLNLDLWVITSESTHLKFVS